MTLDEIAEKCKSGVWYVGTVYTQHYCCTECAAEEAASRGAQLANKGVNFYSPIVHWHQIAEYANLPKDHDYWMKIDEPMMDRCDGMIYVKTENHEKSRGLAHEVKYFTAQGKPVLYWDV
jgi:nucleoside 2-deoxyribosyltransferase